MTKQEYLDRVGYELRDLPWKTRRDLLADLDSHLDEVPAERLGDPAAYASELRESAGLYPRRGLVAFLRARRPRNVLAVVTVLTVVGLLAGALAWIESYQPLAFAYGTTEPAGVRTDLPNEDVVIFHDGKPFVFGITVQNTGAFTVRILRVPFVQLHDVDPYSGRIFMSGPLKNGGVYPPYVPFRPFDLKPGEVRLLFLRGVFSHCRDWSGGSQAVVVSFPVTFSFLWRTETVRIPLSRQLVIQIPARRRCRT